MKKVSLFMMAVAVAASSALTSCKKEKGTPPTPPGPTPEKTCVVTKTYDANGKLQSENFYVNDKLSKIESYDSTGTTVNYTSVVSYDAAGNISKVENTDAKGQTSTYTYTYNASGTISKITTTEGDADITINFEYNGTDPKLVSRVRVTVDVFGTPLEVAYSDYTYDSKGNNTQQVAYMIESSGSGMKKSSTINYEYDDKKNPNKSLAAIVLSPAYSGPNNITKETTIDHTNNDAQTVYTTAYEYNSDKYPSKSTRTDDKGMSEISTMEYSCK